MPACSRQNARVALHDFEPGVSVLLERLLDPFQLPAGDRGHQLAVVQLECFDGDNEHIAFAHPVGPRLETFGPVLGIEHIEIKKIGEADKDPGLLGLRIGRAERAGDSVASSAFAGGRHSGGGGVCRRLLGR